MCPLSRLPSAWRICLLLIPGGCFTNVSRALWNILSNSVYSKNRNSYENFKLKLCPCAQTNALGTRTKFQLEIITINVISGILCFRKIILGSSWNVSETPPWLVTRGLWEMEGIKYRIRIYELALICLFCDQYIYKKTYSDNIKANHANKKQASLVYLFKNF